MSIERPEQPIENPESGENVLGWNKEMIVQGLNQIKKNIPKNMSIQEKLAHALKLESMIKETSGVQKLEELKKKPLTKEQAHFIFQNNMTFAFIATNTYNQLVNGEADVEDILNEIKSASKK